MEIKKINIKGKLHKAVRNVKTPELHEVFMRKVLRFMEENNMSYREFARLIDASTVTVGHWFNCRATNLPNAKFLVSTAVVMGTTVEKLLGIC